MLLFASCHPRNEQIGYTSLIRKAFNGKYPQSVGWVNDYDQIYTPNERRFLDSLISAFEKKTTIEIEIMTFDDQMVLADSLDSSTVHLANYWGIGKKYKNNGLSIGICTDCLKLTIRNGRGIEKILSDKETWNIIHNSFIPYFRQGRYFDGTVNGLKELMKVLESKPKL